MFSRRCATAEETKRAGEGFSKVLSAGDVVLLDGPLGAGKTTFVQGVARGLGVEERVTSPTFTLVREHVCFSHPTIKKLHHADVYRIAHLDEVYDLALGELVEEDGVALVEWGELAAPAFGPNVLRIDFAIDDDESRTLRVSGDAAKERKDALTTWAAS